jgi:hypothetical protein
MNYDHIDTLKATIAAIDANLVSRGLLPLCDEALTLLETGEDVGDALDMLDDLCARVGVPACLVDACADAFRAVHNVPSI